MEPKPSFKVRIKQNYSSNDEDKYGEWIRSIDSTLGLLRRRPNDFSNYRVPSKIREVNPESYTPRVVSIGPFHRNKPELHAMEELKWRYTLSFLDHVVEADRGNIEINASHGESSSESSPQILALEKCCKVVLDLETEARAFYAEDINLDKHQIVEMLLVDGCFILEFLIRLQGEYVPQLTTEVGHMRVMGCTRDLMLLENQIPYVILQKLFDVLPSPRRISDKSGELSLQELIYSLLKNESVLSYYDLVPIKIRPLQDATFSHLLDVLYQLCIPTSKISPYKYGQKWGFKSCATELIESGFKISLHPSSMSIVDIKFIEGELFIPNFGIGVSSNMLVRNLIALEQTRNGRPVIISYIRLMSTLVRSRLDIYILKRAGIIINRQNWTELEKYFTKLNMEIISADFVFRDLCEEVNTYRIPVWRWRRVKGYTTIIWYRWRESMKDLKRDYFKNRWSLIAFLAASFVILLTVAQTFYTIRSYYPPYH